MGIASCRLSKYEKLSGVHKLCKSYKCYCKWRNGMAIVLDINLLCEKILDLNITESLLRENGVRIKSINSMDNGDGRMSKR